MYSWSSLGSEFRKTSSSPVGTAESRLGRLFHSSLWDFRFRSPFQPSDKSLGYCQMSLRDKPSHSQYHVRETDFHFRHAPIFPVKLNFASPYPHPLPEGEGIRSLTFRIAS